MALAVDARVDLYIWEFVFGGVGIFAEKEEMTAFLA